MPSAQQREPHGAMVAFEVQHVLVIRIQRGSSCCPAAAGTPRSHHSENLHGPPPDLQPHIPEHLQAGTRRPAASADMAQKLPSKPKRGRLHPPMAHFAAASSSAVSRAAFLSAAARSAAALFSIALRAASLTSQLSSATAFFRGNSFTRDLLSRGVLCCSLSSAASLAAYFSDAVFLASACSAAARSAAASS